MQAWSDGNPLRLQQLPADKSDPDPACDLLLWVVAEGQGTDDVALCGRVSC